MSIELSLLGGFDLTLDGQPVQLKNRKARALLAYLAMAPGQAHGREKLAGLLRGERFDEQARASLRQALHALRRAVGPEVVTGEAELTAPEGAVAVDALAYDRGETPAWAGELMAGFSTGEAGFDDWLEGERARVRRVAAAAFHDAAAQAEGAAGKLALAEQALEVDPYDEVALRSIMSLLAATGARAEALARHATFAARLRRQLDAEPSPETEALLAEIQAGDGPSETGRYKKPRSGIGQMLVAPVVDLGGGGTRRRSLQAKSPARS